MTLLDENTTWYVSGIALDLAGDLWITSHAPELADVAISDEFEFKAEWYEKHMSVD